MSDFPLNRRERRVGTRKDRQYRAACIAYEDGVRALLVEFPEFNDPTRAQTLISMSDETARETGRPRMPLGHPIPGSDVRGVLAHIREIAVAMRHMETR